MENLEVVGVSYITPEYMKALRKRLGMTQSDFADALGTTQIQVSLIETGKRKLSHVFQKKISDLEKQKKKEEKSLMAIQATSTKRVTNEIFYPDSDGQPMADNTLQAFWIILLYSNLRALFHGKEVFVAADLFWFPIEGDPNTKVAPDVLVAFDRPDGYRGSYKQWHEENIPPHVVFEVLSPSNSAMEMLNKLDFYEHHGVLEFVILDPLNHEFTAYVSEDGKLVRANKPDEAWKSPQLGISFQIFDNELAVQYPDGTPFKSFEELQEEKKVIEAEKNAIVEEKDAAIEEKDAVVEERNAIVAEKDAEIERLKALLRELGKNPE